MTPNTTDLQESATRSPEVFAAEAVASRLRLSPLELQVLILIWDQKVSFLPGASLIPKFIPLVPMDFHRIREIISEKLTAQHVQRLVKYDLLEIRTDPRDQSVGYVAGRLSPEYVLAKFNLDHEYADTSWRRE